jgi:hypothetical protein
VRAARLRRLAESSDDAWQVLRETGTTHVIVHHDALPAGEVEVIERWLTERGATQAGQFDNDTLWTIDQRR